MVTPGTTDPLESFTVPLTRELTVWENDKQKVPISKMAKVANTAGLAKTLTGEVEFFIVGSLYGERGCLPGQTHLFSPGYGREVLFDSSLAKRA